MLRLGGNTDRQRERVVAAFEKQKSTAEIADILKNLYHGGNGIGSVTAWYAEDGIHLSHGKTARYDKSAQVISWESAAERIGQLLQDGQFATNVELTEAEGYERACLAEKVWNFYYDFSEKAREAGYLSSLADNPGRGFSEESAWLTEQLKSPEFRQNLAEEYAAFWTAYQQDRDLLRFHYHKPGEIWENLKDLSLPRTTFTSQLTEVPAVKQFITEDEIDAAMTGGSGFAGGKGRIFTFFQAPHTDKEKVDFLKHEYGIGGRSHALSGAMKSDEWHDGKGLHYKKDGCPDVHFTWDKVSKRITGLIQKDRYLTEQEQAEYDKIQAEKALAEADAVETQQPDPAVWDYNGVKERHPDDMVLYQMGDFFE
ncbi:helicase SNF2, partial [Pseudoflavonifractor phocaeensis]|nr:helicase SNF2 [Pseudoflavonifractor phocaeensis]